MFQERVGIVIYSGIDKSELVDPLNPPPMLRALSPSVLITGIMYDQEPHIFFRRVLCLEIIKSNETEHPEMHRSLLISILIWLGSSVCRSTAFHAQSLPIKKAL